MQKAVVELLTSIYEQDFLKCSYGFRPGRGAQDALDEVDRVMWREPISYVLELDITAVGIIRSPVRGAATLAADPAGESPAGGNYPVATVVISDNGEGDRSVESSEVKVSVREASNSAGRSNGEPVSPEIG